MRIQLDITSKMLELIDLLECKTGSATRAEVIRRAISLYGILCEEKWAGKRIEIIDPKNSKVREKLILP